MTPDDPRIIKTSIERYASLLRDLSGSGAAIKYLEALLVDPEAAVARARVEALLRKFCEPTP